jgi:type II secretory pathway component PulM
MDGCGSQISDIDVYRGAVQSYFPNADISFKMDIQINGDAPDADELNRPAKKAVTETRRRNTPVNTSAAASGTVPAAVKEKTETIQLSLF